MLLMSSELFEITERSNIENYRILQKIMKHYAARATSSENRNGHSKVPHGPCKPIVSQSLDKLYSYPVWIFNKEKPYMRVRCNNRGWL